MNTILTLVILLTQVRRPLLKNPQFTDGLSGWKVEGSAKISDKALKLGPGIGNVSQIYDVSGLRILYYGVTLKGNQSDVTGRIRLRCFDKKGRILMDRQADYDPKSYAAIYQKTQAFTHHIVLSIEKTSRSGALTASDLIFQDDDRERIEHSPEVDLDASMEPVWKGDSVFEESVLLVSRAKDSPLGHLLFKPIKVFSVKDSSRKKEFMEGKDFHISGKTLIANNGSTLPTMSESEFAKGDLPWTQLQGRHVFVTYSHGDIWRGPLPSNQRLRLPETTRHLATKKPLTVVAYGDSITLGINVSGFRNVPPYMPPWPTLAIHQLSKIYSDKAIKLYNMGLGGMTSQWAKDNAKDAVASLKPDLVLVGFGMNDFWSLTPELYRKNIEATLSNIRSSCPKCEFILIAPMKFDPIYTSDKTYVENLAGYAGELAKLAGAGVGYLDMTSISAYLYQQKNPKDLMADPMHPNDFLARCYAQSIVALLDKQ